MKFAENDSSKRNNFLNMTNTTRLQSELPFLLLDINNRYATSTEHLPTIKIKKYNEFIVAICKC